MRLEYPRTKTKLNRAIDIFIPAIDSFPWLNNSFLVSIFFYYRTTVQYHTVYSLQPVVLYCNLFNAYVNKKYWTQFTRTPAPTQ